ncbi:MAG TPA: MBL fold metallo-hydrolase [Firmicutes bacterium]|nr:MBL fold metallo-hydrolase [Bacillota bacterium]
MIVRWMGHACFLITSDAGTRILTDPFDETVGYMTPCCEADIVTVSHDHFDHNAVKYVRGNSTVVDDAGDHLIKGAGTEEIPITGYSTWHDEVRGAKRGPNIVFKLRIDGLDVVHMGDIGHVLGSDTVKAIGRVDVLMLPVGGTYTVDAEGAAAIVGELKPAIVFPMHYKTPATGFPIMTAEAFLKKMANVKKVGATSVEINTASIRDAKPAPQVIVLDYQ